MRVVLVINLPTYLAIMGSLRIRKYEEWQVECVGSRREERGKREKYQVAKALPECLK